MLVRGRSNSYGDDEGGHVGMDANTTSTKTKRKRKLSTSPIRTSISNDVVHRNYIIMHSSSDFSVDDDDDDDDETDELIAAATSLLKPAIAHKKKKEVSPKIRKLAGIAEMKDSTPGRLCCVVSCCNVCICE